MRQATAFSVKLLAYLALFGATMPSLSLLALPQSLVLALALIPILWLSDLVVLPRFGNLVATLGDVGILIVGSFMILPTMFAAPNPIGLMLAGAACAAFEWWFHRWLLANAVVE